MKAGEARIILHKVDFSFRKWQQRKIGTLYNDEKNQSYKKLQELYTHINLKKESRYT